MDVTPVSLPTPKLGLLSKIVPDPVRIVLNWGRRYSLWVFNFGLACCAIEFIATSMARHDFIRLGVIPFAPGPRQADLMVVSGTVTDKMAPAVKRLYEQMPEPKYVISFGACSNCGGPYWDSYCVTKGVDQIIPVDVYVPGCPPRPEALLQGIIKLQEKIATESLATRYGNQSPGTDALRRPWQAPPPAPISPWLPATQTPAEDPAKDEAETEELLAVLGFDDDAKTEQLPAQRPPQNPTRDQGPPVPPWGPHPPRAGETRPLPKVEPRPPRGRNIGHLPPSTTSRPGPSDAGPGATRPLPAVPPEAPASPGATQPLPAVPSESAGSPGVTQPVPSESAGSPGVTQPLSAVPSESAGSPGVTQPLPVVPSESPGSSGVTQPLPAVPSESVGSSAAGAAEPGVTEPLPVVSSESVGSSAAGAAEPGVTEPLPVVPSESPASSGVTEPLPAVSSESAGSSAAGAAEPGVTEPLPAVPQESVGPTAPGASKTQPQDTADVAEPEDPEGSEPAAVEAAGADAGASESGVTEPLPTVPPESPPQDVAEGADEDTRPSPSAEGGDGS